MLIGVLGGGQLGRMLALAGLPLGLRFRFLEPTADCPAADAGPVIVGDYADPGALAAFAQGLAVATYEFENVPASTARWLTDRVPVYPPEGILATAQDRLAEKTLFRSLGIGTPEFRAIDDEASLADAARVVGFPCLLKTRRFGYDGKGQWRLDAPADAGSPALRAALGGGPGRLILESFVPFVREVSIIAARSRTGETFCYPLSQNVHAAGILRESIAPARGLTPDLQSRAESIVRRIIDQTGYIGVLAVELFELADGSLLVNEMAPRVHNSGHWTQDGAPVSQFELHLRAILGWPLGAGPGAAGHAGSDAFRPTAMLNLLRGLPDPATVLSLAGAHLHLYNKPPRPGELRKVGHVNIVAESHDELRSRLDAARSALEHCL